MHTSLAALTDRYGPLVTFCESQSMLLTIEGADLA
jgi:hypothetical protein